MLTQGTITTPAVESGVTANIPDSLVNLASQAAIGAADKMEVDQAIESKFSHEVKPLAGSSNTADKIKQRNKLLEAYASKELAAAQ